MSAMNPNDLLIAVPHRNFYHGGHKGAQKKSGPCRASRSCHPERVRRGGRVEGRCYRLFAASNRLTVFSFPNAAITAKRLGATACPVSATRAPLINAPAFTFFS